MIMLQRHLLLVFSTIAVSAAWTVPQRHVQTQSISRANLNMPTPTPTPTPTLLRMSDQWDDEELPAVTSYDDAASSLMKRKEEADMEGMTDEAVPGSETENQEKLRDAVKARTKNLGMGEASQDAMKAMEERAAKRAGSGALDLSQVSDGFEKLSINFDPEDEMSEEEMRQADPLGYQPMSEQYMFELKETTFPGAIATISKVGLLIVLGVVTGFIIISTDKLVRDLYVDQGMLPTKEDIAKAQSSGLEMAQELTKKTSSPGAVSSGGLPDISP